MLYMKRNTPAQTAFKKIILCCLLSSLVSCNLPTTPHNGELSTASPTQTAAAPQATPTLPPARIPRTPQPAEPPLIRVGDVINCRTGPGVNYDRVAQILPGDSAPVIGFFPPNYWIVSTQNGACWVSGEFSTPMGSFAAVPTVTAPPTPLGGAPAAPTFAKNGWTWFCYGSGDTDIELAWKDNADSEKGYRVYRNGELIAELPANSTYFKETTPYPGGMGLQYTVEAFNESGAASAQTEILFCN
ncbi:MAG: hypothetical protein Fur002_01310 [Anaerolineales bacterium]